MTQMSLELYEKKKEGQLLAQQQLEKEDDGAELEIDMKADDVQFAIDQNTSEYVVETTPDVPITLHTDVQKIDAEQKNVD